jgi:hypothetical protein
MPMLSEDRLIIGFLVATVVWGLFGLPFIYLNWDWLMNEAVGFFTFLLFVVGGLQLLLFFWQLTLIRHSLAPAEAASKAALAQANATLAAERAYVKMSHTPPKSPMCSLSLSCCPIVNPFQWPLTTSESLIQISQKRFWSKMTNFITQQSQRFRWPIFQKFKMAQR